MTELLSNEVKRVAGLARLRLTAEEIDYFKDELSSIVTYFTEIDQLKINLGEDFRPDTAGSGTPQRADKAPAANNTELEKIMQSAPARSGSSFLVPKIFD